MDLPCIQMPVSESCCSSLSYLENSLTVISWYLPDKEVAIIGAIAEFTITKMEIKEPSAAHGQVCDCWKAELAPALLSC